MIVTVGIFLVFFIITYMFICRNSITYIDASILIVSIIVFLYTLYSKKNTDEHFADPLQSLSLQDTKTNINTLKPISLDEDYSNITPYCTVYLTIFNKNSYPENDNEWINVAYQEKEGEDCTLKGNRKIYRFENLPVFSKRSGLLLGTNRLYGPYSNMLGISLQSTFTIFFTCKHGDFMPNNEKEVELLKLYANSNNNNGIALFIQRNSIEINNNIQYGNLLLKFIDNDDVYQCKLKSDDTSMSFDKLNMSLYFIVKEVDKIRILYMIGGVNTIYQLAMINIKETNATFSNKEMIINRFQNWKGNMYNFGILPEAISDNTVTDIYSHCYSEYLKATNEDFIKLSNDYNSILDFLKKFKECPYNDDVCKTCNTITKWNDMNEIMSAPPSCKESINEFCKVNTKHELCKCWDQSYPGYQTDSCKMYKSIFTPQSRIYDNITNDDILYIKDKYTLISPADCPKPVVQQQTSCINEKLLKNTYSDYDFEKIKIDPDYLKKVTSKNNKINSPYEFEDTSNKKQISSAFDTEKDQNITKDPPIPFVLKGNEKPIVNKDHAYRLPGSSAKIENIYQTDPNTKFNDKDNIALKEYEKSTELQNTDNPFMSKIMNFFLP
jgi:hypothetical protein